MARDAVLVRLGTDRLDNEIDKQRQTIRAAEEELARIDRLAGLLEGQAAATRSKSEAELAQARAEVHLAKQQREVDVRLAELALGSSKNEESAYRRLVEMRAASHSELLKARMTAREAEGKLARSRLPVNEDRVNVAQRALEMARRDYEVKCEELEQKRQARQVDLRTARIELSNRELERQAVDPIADRRDRHGRRREGRGPPRAGKVVRGGRRRPAIASRRPCRVKRSAGSGSGCRSGSSWMPTITRDMEPLTGRSASSPPIRASPRAAAGSFIVRIELKGDEVGRGPWRGRVRLGMAGRAEIVTGRESVLSLLRQVFQTVYIIELTTKLNAKGSHPLRGEGLARVMVARAAGVQSRSEPEPPTLRWRDSLRVATGHDRGRDHPSTPRYGPVF